VHQLSPAAECRAIHAEDGEGVAHLIEPALDRIGFCRVLIAGEFEPAWISLLEEYGGMA
jgi:hypothetical protein